MNRVEQAQRRMLGRKAWDLIDEIDIVPALMGVGLAFTERQDLGRGALDRPLAHKPVQVEHAGRGKLCLALHDQRQIFARLRPVKRIAFKIKDVAQCAPPKLRPARC